MDRWLSRAEAKTMERSRTGRLLGSLAKGEAGAADELLPLIYDELRRVAGKLMRGERFDHTLQPTALVNEAFLRLVDERVPFESRRHFRCIAARAMRRVLVDHARTHQADKRRGKRQRVTFDEQLGVIASNSSAMLEVDSALDRLEQFDPQLARIVEQHFFGGMPFKEVAESLGIALRTVERSWRLARAWLMRELAAGNRDG